jgi:hypothetical protein
MILEGAQCNAIFSRFSELHQAVYRRKDNTIYGYRQLSFKILFSKIFTKIVKPGIKVKLTVGKSGVTKVVYLKNLTKI